jgi:glycosyltransferase involved in cell wall biosynthesis
VEPVGSDHRAEWKRRRGWPPETRVLLYFGSISPLKQVPWIIEAWRDALADAPTALMIIGDELQVEATAEERRFLDIHSFLQSADVSRVLQVADVLALPFADGVSERRGSFMAGLSHALAVVTTIGQATGPTLRKSDAFIAVPCDDPARFKAKVIELLGDEAHRKSLGARARAAYERAYDWPHVITRLEALLSTKTEPSVA